MTVMPLGWVSRHDIAEFYKLPLEEKMKHKMRASDVEGYGLSDMTQPGYLPRISWVVPPSEVLLYYP